MNKVTCEQVVRMLKEIGVSTTAKHVAERMGTSSRAVATALRAATEDKRVSFRYKKGICWYRFVRFTPRTTQSAKQGEPQK